MSTEPTATSASDSSPAAKEVTTTKEGLAERLALIGVLLLPILVLFKRVPAEIAVGVTVLAALFVAVRRRDFAWLRKGWLYAAAVMSLILLLLSPFSLSPGYSAMSAVLAFRWPVYAAALLWLFLSRSAWLMRFERVMLAVIVFIIIDTVIQYIFGADLFGHVSGSDVRLTGPFDHRLVGTFTDRVWFIGLSLMWFMAFRRGVAAGLLVLSISSAIGALFLFLTGERAALLTFLLGTAVVYLGVFLHYPEWRRRLLLVAMLAVALVAGLAASQKQMVGRSVDSTIHIITHLDETIYGLNFLTAWQEFRAHPWTGVGARQFQEYCNTEMPWNVHRYQEVPPHFPNCVIHPHNFYTGMLAEGGVFAFLALVTMVSLLFWALIRSALTNGQPMSAYFGSALLLTTFWPLQSSMEYFNGWTAAVIWTGVAWAFARARIRVS